MKSFYRFAYSAPLKENEDAKPFKTRDGAAFNELSVGLYALGYEYQDLIYNFPANKQDAVLGREDFSFLQPKDLLALTTRPPLDDLNGGDRRIIKQSGSDLENAIFDRLRACFKICTRSHVRLSEEIAKHLKGEAIKRATMKFHQEKSARLNEYMALDEWHGTRVDPSHYLTSAFFVHIKKINRYGCDLIASFGMGGFETLIWNRMVRNHPKRNTWLTDPVFVLAELDLSSAPSQPISMDFVKNIKPKILLEHPL